MKGWQRLSVAERAVICAALALSIGPVLPAERAYAAGVGPEGQPIFEVIWSVIYVLGLMIALRHRLALWRSLRSNVVVLAPAVVAVASVWWSDSASITERQSIALLLTSIFALTLAELLSLRELFRVFSWVLAVLLVASLFLVFVAPGYGLDHVRGDAWQGLFATKNALGRVAALALAVWVLRFFTLPAKKSALLVVALCVLLLLESRSRTSLVTAVVALGFIALVPMLRADPFRAVAGSMFGIALFGSTALWLATHQELVLSTLNATPTLTGRLQIWKASWYMVHRHFWFGYGYGAFWLGTKGFSTDVWNIVGATPPHAHNGVLDVWLDLGAVGVVFVGLSFLVLVRRAWLLLRAPGSPLNAWPMLFCLFLVVSNLTESDLLVRNSVFWILTVALAAQIVWRPVAASAPASAQFEVSPYGAV